jgi:hypothetical protein
VSSFSRLLGQALLLTLALSATEVAAQVEIRTDPTSLEKASRVAAESLAVDASDDEFEDRVRIRWNEASGSDFVYRLERDGTLLSFLASDVTEYLDETGDPGVVYSYCLRLLDTNGSLVAEDCDAGSRKIFPPESVAASDSLFADGIRITWTDRSGIETGYVIYRRMASDPNAPVAIDTTGANIDRYDDTSVPPGTVFSYCVAATDGNGFESARDSCDIGSRGFVQAPEQVRASDGQYTDRVVLRWGDRSSNELGFNIYRDGSLVGSVAAGITSYPDTGALGVRHTYCVTSFKAMALLAPSPAATTQLGVFESPRVCDDGIGGPETLAPPMNVLASDSEFDDRVEITWEDPTDTEDGYSVLRDGVVLGELEANATAFVDMDAVAGTTYSYCVIAQSDSGGSSVPDSCDAGSRSLVVAPTAAQASDGDFEDRVQITWESASTTVVLFKLYRDGIFVQTVAGHKRTAADTEVDSGADHVYCVTAMTALGTESATSCDTGRRRILAPTGVAASDDAFEDLVRISWTDASLVEDGYRIYRKPAGAAGPPGALGTTPANRTSFNDSTGASGVEYEYSVAAFDDLGESSASRDTGSRTLKPPADVQATDGAFEDAIRITWNDESRREDGYHVYRKRAGSTADSTRIATTPRNTSSFTDADPTLDFGAAYTYWVSAFDAHGESEAGSDQGSTDILPPAAVNASDGYSDRVVVAWVDESAIETEYAISRDGAALGTAPGNATSFTDTTAVPGTRHEYCVHAVSGALRSTPGCDAGGAVSPPAAGDILEMTQGIVASDRTPGDRFGSAVAMSGQDAAVGAPADDNSGGVDCGSVYFFDRRPNGTWVQNTWLRATDSNAGARYGTSVAMDGRFAIAGGPLATGGGAAYVFYRGAARWYIDAAPQTGPPTGRLTPPAGAALFGISAAIDDESAAAVDRVTAIVGSYGDDSFRGAAYVFQRSSTDSAGAIWQRTQRLVANDGEPDDEFGRAVALSGSFAIIGAPGDSVNSVFGAGSAYVFERDPGGLWQQQERLLPGPAANTANFGYSVAIEGGIALVGMPDWECVGGGGVVYVFERGADGRWRETARLVASDGAACGDQFGQAVAIDGALAVVGARSRSAYVFRRDETGRWSEIQKPRARVLATAVAIEDPDLLLGFVQSPGPDSVFAFSLQPLSAQASDGVFEDKVRITWIDSFTNEDGFRIYRDGELLENLAANTRSFSDFDAEPGRTHEYCVTAFGAALDETEPSCDLGRRPPNGDIAGRVVTRAGSGVEGVRVCLDPTPNSSLLFDGSFAHLRVDDAGMPASELTVEFWMRSADGASAGTPLSYAADGLEALAISDYRDFAITVGGQSTATGLAANDGRWHHIAVTWRSSDGRVSVYLDSLDTPILAPVAAGYSLPSGGSLVFGQRSPLGNVLDPGGAFLGELDEIRIWDRTLDLSEIQARLYSTLRGDEAGLVAYWPLDQRNGPAAEELHANAYARVHGGVHWTSEASPLEACAVTDLEGNYTLSRVRYGESTTFKVRPSLDPRQFEPAFKTIVLSTGNPVQNEVDFTDISSFTVAGTVQYRDTPCFAENIEIVVDGLVRGTTDRDGLFAVPVDPGDHVIEARAGDHTFDPARVTITANADIVGLRFLDTTVRTLSGRVGGGCGASIGTLTLNIRSESGCLERSLQSNGEYELRLPPQKYLVFVEAVTDVPAGVDAAEIQEFFDRIGTREVDLFEQDAALDFIYKAPLVVQISGFPQPTCPPPLDVPILVQTVHVDVPLTIEVFENYGGGNLCPVDSGTVTIFDEINDTANEPVVVAIRDGVAKYTTHANTPNIFTGRRDSQGRNRDYQKPITVVAEVAGQSSVSRTEWVIVEGHRPRTSTFTAVSEGIPLLILRDPPGDKSSAFLEREQKFCTELTSSIKLTNTVGAEVKVMLGTEFLAGFGVMVKNKLSIDVGAKLELSIAAEQNNKIEICARTKERFSTSEDAEFIGDGADVFLGLALKLVFAKTDVIKVTGCRVIKSESVAMGIDGIDGFQTIYLFTADHIEKTVIPQLEDLAADPDNADRRFFLEVAKKNWQDHLDLNDFLKRLALPGQDRSFSAGADYEFEESTEATASVDWSVQVNTSAEASLGANFEVAGVGVESKFTAKLELETKAGLGFDIGRTRTVGYKLSDDDPGDFFTVDVKKDLFYGVPVFETESGTSSCPWEPWPDPGSGEARTQPRDGAAVAIDPPVIHQVPVDRPAVFTLFLTNDSQSDETRSYVLRQVQTSNPGGAILRANGNLFPSGLEFTLEPQQTQEVTLAVERGPARFFYEDLELELAPACDSNEALAAKTRFSVDFQAPCSDIRLFRPRPNWTHNQAAGDTVTLVLKDFELRISEAESLAAVGADYRPAGTDVMPVTIGRVSRNEIQTDANGIPISVTVQWPVAGLADGSYELRAFTDCGEKGFSSVATGVIDRSPPAVLATPQPADGVLAFGENISVRFNETIDCEALSPANFSLEYSTGSDFAPASFGFTCSAGGTIVLTPTAPSLSELEGRTLRATVHDVQDLVGNPSAPVQWTFGVQQAAFSWARGSLLQDVEFGSTSTFTEDLTNGRAEDLDFQIESLAAWLSAEPGSGTIRSGEELPIRFSVGDTLELNQSYVDTVHAVVRDAGGAVLHISLLEVRIDVVCNIPTWSVVPSGFEHSMTIVAGLSVAGQRSEDPNDLLAGFVGAQARAVASPDPAQGHLVFLTVYSNRASGEAVRFRSWKSATCELFPASNQVILFEADKRVGSIASPLIIEARQVPEVAEQAIPADLGWTWFSLNLQALPSEMSPTGVLGNLNAREGDLVKAQSGLFSQFSAAIGDWVGSLTQLDNVSTYLLHTQEAGTILHRGNPAIPSLHPVPVTQGWNWIGFPPQNTMGLDFALADLVAALPVRGQSLLKNQFQFAEYDSAAQTWAGDLVAMEPGSGFKLYLRSTPADSHFVYPDSVAAVLAVSRTPWHSNLGRLAAGPLGLGAPGEPGAAAPGHDAVVRKLGAADWSVDPHEFEHDMTVTATLRFADGSAVTGDQVVAAFVGEEVRGVARPLYVARLERYVLFLTVRSRTSGGEAISFRVYDAAQRALFDGAEQLAFRSNGILGSVAEPLVLTADGRRSIEQDLPVFYALRPNFPNPFRPVAAPTRIRYALPHPERVLLQVFDMRGRLVQKLVDARQGPGWYEVAFEGRGLASGVYLYSLQAGPHREQRKLVIVR